jgi:hypothetical protein
VGRVDRCSGMLCGQPGGLGWGGKGVGSACGWVGAVMAAGHMFVRWSSSSAGTSRRCACDAPDAGAGSNRSSSSSSKYASDAVSAVAANQMWVFNWDGPTMCVRAAGVRRMGGRWVACCVMACCAAPKVCHGTASWQLGTCWWAGAAAAAASGAAAVVQQMQQPTNWDVWVGFVILCV